MKAGVSKTFNLLGLNFQGDLGPLTTYTSKKGRRVWFLKTTPSGPSSDWQKIQRDKFRALALAWMNLTQEQRQAWHTAAKRASLRITGYNLWAYLQLTGDRAAIETVERQTGERLLA